MTKEEVMKCDLSGRWKLRNGLIRLLAKRPFGYIDEETKDQWNTYGEHLTNADKDIVVRLPADGEYLI
jgi:hypothetical protein